MPGFDQMFEFVLSLFVIRNWISSWSWSFSPVFQSQLAVLPGNRKNHFPTHMKLHYFHRMSLVLKHVPVWNAWLGSPCYLKCRKYVVQFSQLVIKLSERLLPNETVTRTHVQQELVWSQLLFIEWMLLTSSLAHFGWNFHVNSLFQNGSNKTLHRRSLSLSKFEKLSEFYWHEQDCSSHAENLHTELWIQLIFLKIDK